MLDIRLPLGLLLALLGLLLAGYGAITSGDSMYARYSLGININLLWGFALLLTGLLLLGLFARARRLPDSDPAPPSGGS